MDTVCLHEEYSFELTLETSDTVTMSKGCRQSSLFQACGTATENARDSTKDDTRCTPKHPLSVDEHTR